MDSTGQRYRSISRMTATRKVLQRYLNKYESEGNSTSYQPSDDVPNSIHDIVVSRRSSTSRPNDVISGSLNSGLVSRTSSRHNFYFSLHSAKDPSRSLPNDREFPKAREDPSPHLSTPGMGDSGLEDMGDVDLSTLQELQQHRRETILHLQNSSGVSDSAAKPSSAESLPDVPREIESNINVSSEVTTSPAKKSDAPSGQIRTRRRSERRVLASSVSNNSASTSDVRSIEPSQSETPAKDDISNRLSMPPPPPPPQSLKAETPVQDSPMKNNSSQDKPSGDPSVSLQKFPLDEMIDKVRKMPTYSPSHVNRL